MAKANYYGCPKNPCSHAHTDANCSHMGIFLSENIMIGLFTENLQSDDCVRTFDMNSEISTKIQHATVLWSIGLQLEIEVFLSMGIFIACFVAKIPVDLVDPVYAQIFHFSKKWRLQHKAVQLTDLCCWNYKWEYLLMSDSRAYDQGETLVRRFMYTSEFLEGRLTSHLDAGDFFLYYMTGHLIFLISKKTFTRC